MPKKTKTLVHLDEPIVSIDPLVHSKIMYWVNKSSVEISGLGKVVLEGNKYRVVDAILLKQENSATETEIDAKAIAKAMFETKDSDGTLNFWWHSHVNMGTFWSGTDHDTMNQLGKNGWFISSVFNKKGSIRSAYFQGNNNGYPSIFVDGIKTEISKHIPESIESKWEEEYASKCTEITYQPVIGYGTHKGHPTLSRDEQINLLEGYDFSFHDDKIVDHITYNALSQKEKMEWFQRFVDSYGENPVSDEELEEFYNEMYQYTDSFV